MIGDFLINVVYAVIASLMSVSLSQALEPGKVSTKPPTAAPAQPKATPADKVDKLKTETIKLGSHTLVVEIADTEATRERGLMYRKHMGENEGMLFVFDAPEPLSFWMKNTLIPLSIGYFGADRKLIEVHEMVPAAMGDMYPKGYPASRPAMYALEMNKGWFSKNRIKPGTLLARPRPSTSSP